MKKSKIYTSLWLHGSYMIPSQKRDVFRCQAIIYQKNMCFSPSIPSFSVGQQLVTQWYDVQQLAFLYNLAKTAAHKNLSISSTAKFARNPRNRQDFHRPDGKNPRVLTPTTTIVNFFRAQYVAGFREDDGIRSIDKVLHTLSQEPCLKATSQELQPSNLQIMFQRKWSHTRNIGTLQLLTLLKIRLFKGEPLLMFNYFGMHKRSLELIKAKEHQKFVQYFTTGYMPDESFISNIVLLIHHIARASAQNARALGLSTNTGSQVGSRIVMSCSNVMQEYLRKNGDVACKELRVFCKNKTPIHDKIDCDKGRSDEFYYWFGIEEALEPKLLASLMTGIPVA
ncbi:hypothetical protein N7449_005236 [Penicillium cf. viridicatum]|uniref:Uncharacterized protein n=1 Tax=Penicillium cf. viridicatum TaxID=2972119 RepID=A0A9W9MKX0_9EURO|nr:hypothetical protein N7449_005236 [Penicillium cf. viridicatum]